MYCTRRVSGPTVRHCYILHSNKQTALRSKNKDSLTRNEDNVSEWSDMPIPDCRFSELTL